MNDLLNDFRYALRTLRKSPIFTTIAVLSIAIGLGANTAIFTLVDQVLLRLLPVKDPQQLVLLQGKGRYFGQWQGDEYSLTYPLYTDFRDHDIDIFSGVFARRNWAMQVSYQGHTERVAGEMVSGTYFPVLGVGAALGRVITPEDDLKPGAHPVAVLSYDYWRTRFAADPNVIGQKLIVNNYPLTIIGVSQQGFDGVDAGGVPQVRVPIMMEKEISASPTSTRLQDRRWRWVHIFARLRPGVTAEQAKARLQPFYQSILNMESKEAAFSGVPDDVKQDFVKGTIDVVPAAQGRPSFQRNLTRPLWVLMAIVAGLLLIACANVANLLLARAAARQREIAVRLALGAGRARIVRQLLVESLVLAAAGSLLGLVFASWGASLLLSLIVVDAERVVAASAAPDPRILAFNFVVALFTGVLFGLAPALQSTQLELARTLKDQAGSVLGGGQLRLRKALVVTQVALSLLLLIGAGLFVRSLHNLLTLDVGFKTENLIAFSIDPRLNGYTAVRTKELYKSLMQRLDTTPGVESTAGSMQPMLDANQWRTNVAVEGYRPKPREDMSPSANTVTPDYFKTMGTPVVVGREFTATDERTRSTEERKGAIGLSGLRVAIINESFAKHYFGNENPVGRHVGFDDGKGNSPTPIEVVGVVKDTKYFSLRDDMPRQVYFPILEDDTPGGVTMYVRTSNPSSAMFNLVRQVMTELDPNLPIFAMRTIDDQMNKSASNDRMIASLSSIFSTLATLLAMIGLYGVMAYTVSRRTREIGIRMALGAVSGNIAWQVMRELLVLVLIGMAIAAPGAWALSQTVRSQLFGVTPGDPVTLIAAPLALLIVAALAGLVPALRAVRVNPIKALRYE
jgi:predicted permease